jgi:hypothetical protein
MLPSNSIEVSIYNYRLFEDVIFTFHHGNLQNLLKTDLATAVTSRLLVFMSKVGEFTVE